MATPLILIPMSDYGHDPTETSVPYTAFKEAGFEVHFATENGKAPECDKKMLRGVAQKLLVIVTPPPCHPPHADASLLGRNRQSSQTLRCDGPSPRVPKATLMELTRLLS
jgi:putative intracellular protease/amidase